MDRTDTTSLLALIDEVNALRKQKAELISALGDLLDSDDTDLANESEMWGRKGLNDDTAPSGRNPLAFLPGTRARYVVDAMAAIEKATDSGRYANIVARHSHFSVPQS